MPRPAVLLLALPLGCAAPPEGPEAAPAPRAGTFSALTYNVAGLPGPVAKTDPQRAMPFIGPLLNIYDVALLQEDFAFHALLDEAAAHPHRSTPMSKEQKKSLVGDGLNRFSRHPFGELRRVRWVACHGGFDSGASDCLATKGFSVATTEFAPGASVDVYNLHCEAGGGREDEAARAAGVRQLVDFVAANSAGRAVILGGDFNLHRGDPTDAALLQLLFDELGLVEVTEWLGARRDRIDMFLFRSGGGVELAPVSWEVADEFTYPDGGALSDHRAIHVRFAWTTTP